MGQEQTFEHEGVTITYVVQSPTEAVAKYEGKTFALAAAEGGGAYIPNCGAAQAAVAALALHIWPRKAAGPSVTTTPRRGW